MCLAIPMRVISIEGERAVVEQGGARRTISIGLIEEVSPQDYVLVHAGYAIARVDEEEARRTLELIEQLAQAADRPEGPQ
jgi:hydrogenase expression/formation protein HypC